MKAPKTCIVKCEDCGKEYSIGYKSFKKNRPHVCKKCAGKRNVWKLREGHKKYFSDPANIQKHSEICQDVWNNRPEEFKNKRLTDLKRIGDEFRSNPENIKSAAEKIREYYSHPENREAQSRKKKAYWDRQSPEEREILMMHLVDYWDNISEDQLDDWYKNILDGMIASGVIKEGPTESIFINDLHRISLGEKKVNYQRQYRSQTKAPDFEIMFPNNPITGGKHVNPYHIWDFIIFSDGGNILVDVDGKIHDIKPGKAMYGDTEVDLSELVKFNDSKRIYQTDSIDAYIVRAYDNTLNDNTDVLSLKTNTIIKYKDLLNIIYVSQLNKSEWKSLKE